MEAAGDEAVAGEIARERDIAVDGNAVIGLDRRIAQRQHPAGARVDGLGMDVEIVLEQDPAHLGIGREARDRDGIVDIMAEAERRGGNRDIALAVATAS